MKKGGARTRDGPLSAAARMQRGAVSYVEVEVKRYASGGNFGGNFKKRIRKGLSESTYWKGYSVEATE